MALVPQNTEKVLNWLLKTLVWLAEPAMCTGSGLWSSRLWSSSSPWVERAGSRMGEEEERGMNMNSQPVAVEPLPGGGEVLFVGFDPGNWLLRTFPWRKEGYFKRRPGRRGASRCSFFVGLQSNFLLHL